MSNKMFIFTLMIISLQSCTKNMITQQDKLEPQRTITATGNQILDLPSSTPEMHGTLVILPSPTPTFISSQVPEFQYPHWTPIPTERIVDVHEEINRLLHSQACESPCWWDFTPGETKWSDAEKILLGLGGYITPGGILGYGGVSAESGQVRYGVNIPIGRGDYYLMQDYTVEDGLIVDMGAYYWDYAPILNLPEFVKAHGKPSEIWIRTYRNEWRGSQPFTLALFYLEKGILIEYPADGGKKTTDMVEGCFRNARFPFLYQWEPGSTRTFAEAANKFLYLEDWEFLPIDKASSMSVDEFYSKVMETNNPICVQTPAILWREQ